jgi:predicted acylesterase/phospholipase RssA
MMSSAPTLERLRAARRLGLVFAGGSLRCAFQVGVIETLRELGVCPALLVAVSGGVWNAAAVAAGTDRRLRRYWREYVRMPHVDVKNILREHSPFLYGEVHRRTFPRYVGAERLKAAPIPLWIGLTRLSDMSAAFFDVRRTDDPLHLLLASNYLPPFFTHAPMIDGQRYGDGGFVDNLPYEKAFAEGCDAVVLVTVRGESEGLPFKSAADPAHEFPPAVRERLIVIRPRHRLPASFTERRWPVLQQTIEIGRLRARELLLGESHAETQVRGDQGRLAARISDLLLSKAAAALAARRRPDPRPAG